MPVHPECWWDETDRREPFRCESCGKVLYDPDCFDELCYWCAQLALVEDEYT